MIPDPFKQILYPAPDMEVINKVLSGIVKERQEEARQQYRDFINRKCKKRGRIK